MMNLNLKKISQLFGLGMILITMPIDLAAQSKSKYSYGGSLNLGLGSAVITNDAYQQYMDTVLSRTNAVMVKGVHAWFTYSLSQKTDLHLGLGYQEAAYGRRQENLNFQNYTYPGIGTGSIEDLSNLEKGIQDIYRYSYLQVPAQLSLNFARSGDFQWTYSFVPGGALNVLLNQSMIANLDDGFSIDGENRFVMDSTGFKARPLTFNLSAGVRFQNRNEAGEIYFIQPNVILFPMSVSSKELTAIPFSINVQFGMLFNGSRK